MGGVHSGGVQGEHDRTWRVVVSWMGGGLMPRILFGAQFVDCVDGDVGVDVLFVISIVHCGGGCFGGCSLSCLCGVALMCLGACGWAQQCLHV